MTCRCVFLGGQPPKITEGYERPPSHPPSNPPPWASTVEAHPRVGGAVWPESSHGTLAGFGSKRMEVKLEKNQRLKSWNGPWGRSCFWRELWASKYYPMISHEKNTLIKGNKNDLQNCGCENIRGENGLQKKRVKQQHAEDETISPTHPTLPGAIPPVFYRGP